MCRVRRPLKTSLSHYTWKDKIRETTTHDDKTVLGRWWFVFIFVQAVTESYQEFHDIRYCHYYVCYPKSIIRHRFSALIMFKFVAILSAVLLCALVRGQGDPVAEKMDVFRLPENTNPISYSLLFAPNFSNWTVTGVANITITVLQLTDKVTLNLKNLTVTDVLVMDITDNTIRTIPIAGTPKYLTKNEQFEIEFIRPIPSNKRLLLNINYEGKIRDDMTGLYKSSYTDDGETKWAPLNCIVIIVICRFRIIILSTSSNAKFLFLRENPPSELSHNSKL